MPDQLDEKALPVLARTSVPRKDIAVEQIGNSVARSSSEQRNAQVGMVCCLCSCIFPFLIQREAETRCESLPL
jgi:hypothetical protein